MRKLPILMYHNVTADSTKSVGLTISTAMLEQQFQYLVARGYKTVHFKEWKELESEKDKVVILTFDDVTVNQLEYAVPLLEKYNLKATFFIPFAYVGKTDEWNKGTEPLMNIEQLKGLDTRIELGYHSFYHRPYAKLSPEEISEDFKLCKAFCVENQLEVFPVLAYPYGNFPKKEPLKTTFFTQMKKEGMLFALRIGNKVNKSLTSNPYELNRLDVKGEEPLWKFKLKLRFGKLF